MKNLIKSDNIMIVKSFVISYASLGKRQDLEIDES